MIVYHGTNNSELTLDKLDSRHSINNSFGPGTYFTEHLDTAKQYGSNIITLGIDENKLVDGMKYKFRDISKLRANGYIGALINLGGIVRNVVIWNMYDVTHTDKDDTEYNEWLKQWNKDNKWRSDW